uniref:Uncharacterized protein n=1 Tax=viral metagenome TaxID=1070528 RepID=A0A6M3X7B7_9ZZZZ
MGQNQRGKRDGTGPHKDSFQKQNVGTGRRQQAGEICPVKKKVEPSGLGEWADKRRG